VPAAFFVALRLAARAALCLVPTKDVGPGVDSSVYVFFVGRDPCRNFVVDDSMAGWSKYGGIMQRRIVGAHLRALLLVLMLLTTHCGPTDEGPDRAELAPSTVTWVTWEVSSQAEQQLIRQFQETYPQITFDRQSANGGIDRYLEQTLRPDLINSDAGRSLREAAQRGELADLTELWRESGLLESIPASLQQVSAIDGKQFYVPVAFGWAGIYYNKAVFAQYNLTPPTTWEEFLALCDTLLIQGETPLAIGGEDSFSAFLWFQYLTLRLHGSTFYRDLMSGRERFDDPRIYTVLETWRALFTQGYVIPDRRMVGGMQLLTTLVRNDKGMLGSQKAVMALADTYNVGGLPAPFLAELGFFRFPIIEQSVPVAEILSPFGYAVPVGASHVPAALAFLSHASAPETQLVFTQHSMFQGIKYAPVRVDVAAEQLAEEQRVTLAFVQETAEAVLPVWADVSWRFFGLTEYEIGQFVEQQDIDRFIQKFTELQQQMIEQGLLSEE